jgi:DNA-binding Lrp family transcriptional regulator
MRHGKERMVLFMDSLIKLLKGNARLSNEQLAVMLGVTPEEVAARIADYEKRGVIKGYSVILNEELADKNAVTAFIEVKVTPKADFGFDELARTIMMYDEVDSVTLMSGSFDLAVTLSGTNYKEIALFVAKRLSSIDGVISTSTHFVLKQYKEQGFFIENEAADERGFVSP